MGIENLKKKMEICRDIHDPCKTFYLECSQTLGCKEKKHKTKKKKEKKKSHTTVVYKLMTWGFKRFL